STRCWRGCAHTSRRARPSGWTKSTAGRCGNCAPRSASILVALIQSGEAGPRHRESLRQPSATRRHWLCDNARRSRCPHPGPTERQMAVPGSFTAFRIHNDGAGHRSGLEELSLDELAPGEIVVKAAFSSVNYKDALAGTGKGRILREFPLVGGIDLAGHVVSSADPRLREGDEVLVTGSGLSETRDGGYAQYARVEAKWAIPLPMGLSLRESMILGTAGFTAALALLRMEENRQHPSLGPLAVT